MFSPALVRYILDPENTLEHCEENTETPVNNYFCKGGTVDIEKVKTDCNSFHYLFGKIKEIFAAKRSCEVEVYKAE